MNLWLRIDFDDGARLGPGKIALLEAVAETGSISAAAKKIGMSYRRAWVLIDAVNKTCVSPAVLAGPGGSGGGGAALTPTGVALIAEFRALEQEVGRAAQDRLNRLAALKAGL